MPRSLVPLIAAGLVVAGGVVASAESDRATGRVDRHSFSWVDEQLSTTSTEWKNIPGLKISTGCGNTRSVATVSVDLAADSSPIQLRVAIDDPIQRCTDCSALDGLLAPPAISVDRTSSFRFVGRTPQSGASFHAQWRIDPDAHGDASGMIDAATHHVLWTRAGIKGSPRQGVSC